MNDKDKEAFERWKLTFSNERIKTMSRYTWEQIIKNIMSEAWQAACEYKKEEIDELIGQLKSCVFVYEEKLDRLIAENAKLRECVDFYADKEGQVWAACQEEDTKDTCCHMVGESSEGKRARQVLKELEDK